jgi:hypothetical protein
VLVDIDHVRFGFDIDQTLVLLGALGVLFVEQTTQRMLATRSCWNNGLVVVLLDCLSQHAHVFNLRVLSVHMILANCAILVHYSKLARCFTHVRGFGSSYEPSAIH